MCSFIDEVNIHLEKGASIDGTIAQDGDSG